MGCHKHGGQPEVSCCCFKVVAATITGRQVAATGGLQQHQLQQQVVAKMVAATNGWDSKQWQ